MTTHKKQTRKIFATVAAYIASGVIGAGTACGVYELTDNRFEEAKTPHALIVRTGFEQRLAVIEDSQKDLALTDDEGMATALEEKKSRFVADVIMEKELGERDLATLASRFNAIPSSDGIAFRFSGYSLQSAAYRNECLAEVDDTQAVADAADEVQDCMAEMSEIRAEIQGVLGAGGLLAGLGLYAATAPARRRLDEKMKDRAARKKSAHPHAPHKK